MTCPFPHCKLWLQPLVCNGSTPTLRKSAAVQAAIAAEPKPVRVPRERPAPVVHDEGPLILVETRKDLSLMQLPFEKGKNRLPATTPKQTAFRHHRAKGTVWMGPWPFFIDRLLIFSVKPCCF